ncbi:MAG: VWA domain-containing protein [Vicinamibacterales bacterium]
MSFSAMAAWQAWSVMALAAGVAAWLFFLKVRPPRVNVASLLLWRKVLDQQREMSWWERIRRAVSLVATVLVALALAIAVARPGPRASAASAGRLLIVLDSSWSMLARTSSGDTRWSRAVAGARALAASAGSDAVAIATTADGLVEGPTTDSALVETALDRLRPSGGEGAAWPHVGGTDQVHFFTDGAVGRQLASDVVVHSVYEAAPNVAITALGVRPAATGQSSAEAYLEVANYSPDPQTVTLTVTRGTAVVFGQPVEMAAGEAVRQVIPLGDAGDPRIRASVSAAADALDADDEAVGWLPEAEGLAVTVVSADPGPLGLLLSRAPGVTPTFVAPGAYDPAAGHPDVLVFDRWVPAEAPTRPAMVVASPIAAPWLGTLGDEERTPHWVQNAPHPVLAGVDPLTIDIKRARAIRQDALGPIASSEAGTPLVSVRETGGQRLVVMGFAPGESNLAYAAAFPVLMGNVLEWLGRPALDSPRRPGPMLLPSSATRVVGPDGRPADLRTAGDHRLAMLDQPGLYRVEFGTAHGVVEVNVGSSDVSNLGRTTLPADVTSSAAGLTGAGRPWWLYAVLFALVLAAVEWWTWLRRITV